MISENCCKILGLIKDENYAIKAKAKKKKKADKPVL